MRATTLIPDPTVITVERIAPDDTDVVLVAHTRRCTVAFPVCGQPATRVHSRYIRSLRDLVWQGIAVRMEEFQGVVRTRDILAPMPWLTATESSGLRELREFAAGLRRDMAAAEAAVTFEWSSGQVEGQITRLKLVKRSRYGRAGFPPVRQRYW